MLALFNTAVHTGTNSGTGGEYLVHRLQAMGREGNTTLAALELRTQPRC